MLARVLSTIEGLKFVSVCPYIYICVCDHDLLLYGLRDEGGREGSRGIE